MGGKLRDIKETASNAADIIHEMGTPEVRSSLDMAKDTMKDVKEIVEALSTPTMVSNIENMQRMAQSMQDAAARIENTVRELRDSGVIEEAKKASESARRAMNTFGSVGGDSEMKNLSKETLRAVKELVEELRLAVAESGRSGTIKNAHEVAKEAYSLKKTMV